MKKFEKEKADRTWERIFENFYELRNGDMLIRDTPHGICPRCGKLNKLDSNEKKAWAFGVDRDDYHGCRAYVPDDIHEKDRKLLKDFKNKVVNLPAKFCEDCEGKPIPKWKTDE